MRKRALRILLAALTFSTLLAATAGAQSAAQAAAEDFAAWMSGPVSVLMLDEELELLHRVAGTSLEARFVEWFWARRDPDPSTTANELRRRFQERRAYADKEFDEPRRGLAGWATPRGQIHLLLGDPLATLRSGARFYVDGAFRSLEIWEYDHPHRPGVVRFAFVKTDDGVRLAVARGGRLTFEQVDLLETVRAELVDRERVGDFETVGRRHHQPLPLEATLSALDDGILANVALPLQALLGEPSDDGIRYRIAIAARSDVGADVSTDRYLGAIDVTLSAADHREWSDRPLQIAVWVPRATRSLRLTELPTGRSTAVTVAPEVGAHQPLPVARTLAVAALAGGNAAVAYFPTCPQRHPVAEGLLISAADAGGVSPLPGGRLALAQPVPAARSPR